MVHIPDDYVRNESPITCSGEREVITYTPKYLDDGTLQLQPSGSEDLYAFIQSHAESTDIHVLLQRYADGDTGCLSRVQGTYGDFTEMPKTYAEMLNRINEGKAVFEGLPVEVRARFDHSFETFLSSYGTQDWFDALGIRVGTDSSVPDDGGVHDDNVVVPTEVKE